MADPVASGSDVSAGTYACTECGYELSTQSTESLRPCPQCANGSWHTVSGGDSADDPA
jgi:predicted  nucleic acid-binding Zn-ribbon protein